METTVSSSSHLPVIRGRIPKEGEKEFVEMMNYESGDADACAKKCAGADTEPWMNILNYHEPGSLPGFELIMANPKVRQRIRGKAMDVGAGTCWMTAKLSHIPSVNQVYAVDMSERFLATTGVRMMKRFDADLDKVTLVVSDFNDIPIESESVDCAFLWASIHHSLSPIKTIKEVGRCLRKGGTLFIWEGPVSVFKIRQHRKTMLSASTSQTEIAYTRGELEYLIQNAWLGPFESLPFSTQAGWKGAVRHGLRRVGLEDYVLHPPTYLFMVTKT